jgi:signal transduction histidine kinase
MPSLFVAAIANCGIGLYALSQQHRRAVVWAFAAMAIGMGGWVGSFALLAASRNFAFDHPTHESGLLMILGLLLLAQTFPHGALRGGLRLVAYAPLAFAALYLVPAGLVIQSDTFTASGQIIPVLGRGYVFFLVCVLSYVAASIALLARTFVRSRGTDRERMQYFFLGIAIFLAAFALFDLVLPLAGLSYLNVLGPLASIVFVALTGYSILQHQLMDIRVVIQRGVLYSILLGIIVALYLALANYIVLVSGAAYASVAPIAALVTSVIGIFGAPQFERQFRRWTDKIFFKDTYDYAEAMHALSEILFSTMTFDALVKNVEAMLAGIMRATYVRVTFAPEGPHPSLTIQVPSTGSTRDVTIPLFHDGHELGRLEAGPKRSGDPYSREDVRFLTTFTYQAATALSRARLYQQVERHAHELEDKVEERTRQLRALQEEQRQMMIDISHNLQTPLSVLKIKLEKAGELVRDLGIMQSIESLSEFIYDLLSLSSIERAMEREPSERFSLSELVEELAEEVETIANDRGITIERSVQSGIVFCGNKKRLREAVLNLASNAVKYMGDGPRKEIGIALALSNHSIELSVSDTGIGIAAKDLQKIFDRLYRVEGSQHAIRGTGIGLAITKRIVEQQGGNVRVASEPGQGSTFTITLPS